VVGNLTNKISFFLKRGYLLNPDILKVIDESLFERLGGQFESGDKPVVLTKDIKKILEKKGFKFNANWNDFEKARVDYEKGEDSEVYLTFLEVSDHNLPNVVGEDNIQEREENVVTEETSENGASMPIVLKNYCDKGAKVDVSSFVAYYKIRYNYLRKVLQTRNGLSGVLSINRLGNKRKGEKISTMGIVYSKETTKNGHVVLELEDVTGMVKVLIMKTKDDLYNDGIDVVCDEVIGITGVVGDKIIFADKIFFPEFPKSNNIKKGGVEEYAAFISDVNVGSDVFLEDNFLKFINWMNGNYGNKEQREKGSKVKYLFVVGDLVDGVGVYPGQESNLKINDITAQYNRLAELFSMIRKDIQIIACPGDHDALRLAEPQPYLDKSIAESVWNLGNVTLVTNPSLVNVGATKNFGGFNVLLYHGRSFSYFIDVLDSVREAGGYDGIDYLLKLLLKKRHLAPSHESTLTVIDKEEDAMLIEEVPDFFAVGHIHRCKVEQHGVTTLISGSCWQPLTDYQEKLGHNPEPARVPIVNLESREVSVMKFIDD